MPSNQRKKHIAIIGAGPSGLVAAKTLIHHPTASYTVTLFDAHHSLGGLWANGGLLAPQMPTNLSKYTVCFSDYAWESVTGLEGEFVGMFPRAWMVARYLRGYAQAFIPTTMMKLGCRILSAEKGEVWKVKWREEGKDGEEEFDAVIVASGFFAAPRAWSVLGGKMPASVKIVHSSRFKLLQDVLPDDWNGKGDILVVGGSMSGAEAAASLALLLSDLRYGPHSKKDTTESTARIVHVIPHPFYAVPPFVKADATSTAASFLPADLCFYDLSRRQQHPIRASCGAIPAEKARLSHAYMRSLVGDQADLGAEALVTESIDEPAYIALTAGGTYPEFVREGLIVPIRGRVTRLEDGESAMRVVAHVEGSAQVKNRELRDIVGVVYATGYTPFPALDFLPESIKMALEIDTECHRLPILLSNFQTSNPAVPDLGFIGFYEGPYWGIAEMQARLLAVAWSKDGMTPNIEADYPDTLAHQRSLGLALKHSSPSIPQYWNGDYMGQMAHLASNLSLFTSHNTIFSPNKGPLTPSRYLSQNPSSQSKIESNISLSSLKRTLSNKSSTHASIAAFRAMHGPWNITRTIISARADFPSGSLTGTAHFHPRMSTAKGQEAEYLYAESGVFSTSTGFTMNASRKYVYRISEEKDKMSVWFVKEDGVVDYLFLDLEVVLVEHGKNEVGRSVCRAKSTHGCAPDVYEAEYEWIFRNVAVEEMKVVYRVTGPKKDYVSTTLYER